MNERPFSPASAQRLFNAVSECGTGTLVADLHNDNLRCVPTPDNTANAVSIPAHRPRRFEASTQLDSR